MLHNNIEKIRIYLSRIGQAPGTEIIYPIHVDDILDYRLMFLRDMEEFLIE